MASVFKRNGKGNYVVQFYDHSGVRKERSSRTTDKRAAEQLAAKLEADAMLRREGIIDPRDEQFARQREIHVSKHLEIYLAERRTKVSEGHWKTIKKQLERLIDDSKANRVIELTDERVDAHLRRLLQTPVKQLRAAKGEPRYIGTTTANGVRSAAVAFLNWAVRTKRIPYNPCAALEKLAETGPKRVLRRALSSGELARLVESSGPRGDVYLVAALTGLRVKELTLLSWGQIHLAAAALLVPAHISKSKRDDWIALHPDVIATFQRLKPSDALATDRVFLSIPTTRTLSADLKRAGIQEFDAERRRIDRHALRTTAGTLLLQAGGSLAEVKLQMRHASIETTLKHYADLGLADQKRAVAKLGPFLGTAATSELRATGTDGPSTVGPSSVTPPEAVQPPQHRPQHSQHFLRPILTTGDMPLPNSLSEAELGERLNCASIYEALRVLTTRDQKAGEEDRTPDIQLGKLTFYR
jgi:integrase